MPRIQSYSWALVALLSSLLLTVACGGGNPDDSGSAGDGGDGGVSTNAGRLTVELLMPDDILASGSFILLQEHEQYGVYDTSDGAIELPEGKYTVCPGDSSETDSQGKPLLTVNGQQWTAQDQDVDVISSSTVTATVDMNLYWKLENVHCTYDGYRWDTDSGSWKFDDTYDLSTHTLEVLDGYKVTTNNQEFASFDFFDGSDYLYMDGDTLMYESTWENNQLTEWDLGPNSISFVLMEKNWYRLDIVCK